MESQKDDTSTPGLPLTELSPSNERTQAIAHNDENLLPSTGAEDDVRPLTGIRFVVLYACILSGNFFTGYVSRTRNVNRHGASADKDLKDTSCVTTLTPIISDEFHSIADVGWYGVAFIMASTSTLLTFGKLYTMFSMKIVFMVSYLIFAIGSAISASAPTSAAFIVGRAISGLGSAGIFSGGSIILSRTTSLRYRATFQGVSGGLECTALALGPLLSGAIAHGSSWRVAFYILVPIAACNFAAIGICIPKLPHAPSEDTDEHHWTRRIDLPGLALFLPANICFTLALQWAGTVYSWSNARIIALLILAGLLAIAFALTERWQGDLAMFPLHLLRQRSITLGAITQFCISACLFVYGFYLPIYFQSIRGASVFESGLMYLPTSIAFAIAILSAGYATSAIGYYTPIMALGSILLAVGSGLMTTLQITTPASEWIGYQVSFGIGAGLSFQQTYTAVQTILPEKYVPTALVCLSFTQELGGVVALTVAQNVFLNLIVSRFRGIVPGLKRQSIIQEGTVNLPRIIPEQYRSDIYHAYNRTIVDVFYIGLAAAILTTCSLAIEWRSVREDKLGTEQEATSDGPTN